MYRSEHNRQSYQPTPHRPPPHRPPPHHHPPRYHLQHPKFTEFFCEEELQSQSITTMMIMKMEECFMIGKGGSLILSLVGEADFRTLIGEACFLILFFFFMGALMLS